MGEEIIKTTKARLAGVLKVAPASYVEPGRPKYPSDLSPIARRTFKRICHQLEMRRTLSEGDYDVVVMYARLDARRAKAQESIDAEGEIISTPDGPRTNPALAIAERTEARMLSILDRLGLSPVARDRVKVCRRVAEPDTIEILLSPTKTEGETK